MADLNQVISRNSTTGASVRDGARRPPQHVINSVMQQIQQAQSKPAGTTGDSDAIMGSDKSSGLPKQAGKVPRPLAAEQGLAPDAVRALVQELEAASSSGREGRNPPSGLIAPPDPTGQGHTTATPDLGSTTERGAVLGGEMQRSKGSGLTGARAAVGTERAGGPSSGHSRERATLHRPLISAIADQGPGLTDGLPTGNPEAPHVAEVIPMAYGSWLGGSGLSDSALNRNVAQGLEAELMGTNPSVPPPAGPPQGPPPGIAASAVAKSSVSCSKSAIVTADLNPAEKAKFERQLMGYVPVPRGTTESGATSTGLMVYKSPTKGQRAGMTMDEKLRCYMEQAAHVARISQDRAIKATEMAATEALAARYQEH